MNESVVRCGQLKREAIDTLFCLGVLACVKTDGCSVFGYSCACHDADMAQVIPPPVYEISVVQPQT